MTDTLKEPAVRAKLSPTNTALFETVEDYLLWVAQIADFKQFDRYYRQAGEQGSSLQFFRNARAWDKRAAVEAVLKRTLCTDGTTLFDAMQQKAKQKPR